MKQRSWYRKVNKNDGNQDIAHLIWELRLSRLDYVSHYLTSEFTDKPTPPPTPTPPPNTPLLSFQLVVQRTKYYKQNLILLLFWLYHYYNTHKYQHRPRKNHTWLTVRCKWMVEACSQWTLTMSAPALIKSGTRCSGSTIICRILIPYEQFFWGLYNDPIGRNKRRKDYQMYIQRKICYRTQGIDHKRSNCNVWNKTTIHDINMNPITTSQLHCFYLDKVREKC